MISLRYEGLPVLFGQRGPVGFAWRGIALVTFAEIVQVLVEQSMANYI